MPLGIVMIHIRLTRKLANMLNGIDLSKVSVGDILLVSESIATMLICEGWGELVGDQP